MPMTLILGRVGCGKTAYMAREIAEYIDKEQEKITLLVPDQYTVASEQYFLSRLQEKRFRFLNVTSLKSLARTSFAAYGITFDFLGDGGKTVLLKKALDAVSPQLRYYPENYRNPRFLALLAGTFQELKAANISAEDFMKTALVQKNDKLYDLAMIRQVYEESLSAGHADPEDNLARLKELLEKTGDFENQRVYVANFRTFYNRERSILLQMVKNGAHVTVALPTDTTDPEKAGPTADSAEEARKLDAYCARMGEECRIDNRQDKARFETPELEQLERELIFPGTSTPSSEEPKFIHLYCGLDRFDEAEYAASVIARKVREEGYQYKDFTVIVRSLEDYGGVLDPIFDQYGIPLFYHRKTPLRQRNPIPMIVSLFDLATEGYSRESVLAFVKSGFVTSPEKIAAFEQYVNVWSISYNRFLTPFTRPIGGYTDREREEEVALRQLAEEVRSLVIGRLETFQKHTKNATVREISTALYRLLEAFRVPETLQANAEKYRKHGEGELAARQKKVYEQLMLALDEMVLTAGEDTLSLKEYRDLFFAVIDTHDIAILPTSLDTVIAGSPETLPMISPRCVFVLGLNEGVFPKNVDDNRLLTDQDRQQLSSFEIGETTDDKISHEMFYLYLALTAPREELHLSYAAVLEGKAEPSEAISRVKQIFPGLTLRQFRPSDPESLSQRIQRERAAFALHTQTPVRELEDYFKASPEYGKLLQRREKTASLTKETAGKLYPKNISVSASRANTYHQCQYRYFLTYGLNIREWNRAELDRRQQGNVVHEALEKILPLGLDCTDAVLKARVDAFGEEKLKEFYGDETPPADIQNYFRALMEKIFRLLTLLRKEKDASLFRPYAYEKPVSFVEDGVPPVKIPLDTGSLALTGVVDRVDLYEEGGKKYLRVIDYKTGKKEFSFDRVKNGIDIQMLMYLYALQEKLFPGELCIPAGVQYVGANPPTVSASRKDKADKVEAKWEDETVRSGVYLDREEILQAMDNTAAKRFLRLKKKTSHCIEEERFRQLFSEISDLLREMGNALHRGETAKNPVKIDSYESCEYCPLLSVCRRPPFRDGLAEKEENRE